MFMVRLLRFLKSYLHISMEGGFVERFLNLCARSGIPIWNLTPTERGMEGDTLASQYKRLRPYAKKSGVRLRVRERHGLYFVLRRYRGRWGLALGVAFFVLFISFMSGFIWQIQINGAMTVPETEIRSNLEQVGVRIGARRSSIDAPMAERQMLVQMDALSWIAINLKGSTATIEVRERTLPPQEVDREDAPANIVAEESGLIRRMEVYVGQAVVQPGDTVVQGELLVSGITQTGKGNGEIKRARAMVLAEVPQTLSAAVPLEQEVWVPTGRQSDRRSLVLFGWEMGLRGKPKGEWIGARREAPVKVLGRELPVRLVLTRWEEQERQVIGYTQEQAQQLAEEQLLALEGQQFAEDEILSKTAKGRVEDGVFLLEADYTVLRDIVRTKEFFTK